MNIFFNQLYFLLKQFVMRMFMLHNIKEFFIFVLVDTNSGCNTKINRFIKSTC